MAKHRLIFGCGYLGGRVAARWAAAGDAVTVVTRSAERAAGFHALGYSALVADVTRPETLATLPACDTLVYAVGYDRGGGPPILEVYAQGLRNALAAAPAPPGRVVYVSTTGVYGDAGGDWVDEATPPSPAREGGVASLAAERVLDDRALAGSAVALRLAGLYGPGRVPFLKELRAGEPLAAPERGWLNLIYVEDAADVVLAAADAPRVAGVYCVSDGRPVLRGDYYREAARLVGAGPPAFVEPPAGSPRSARAEANKRVRSDLVWRELSLSPRHGDYRAGLTAALGNQRASG